MRGQLKQVISVTLIMATVGLVLIAIGIGLGGRLSFGIDIKEHTVDTNVNKMVTGKGELDSFSELEIAYDVADIIVIADGTSYSIEYCVYGGKPDITVENNRLKVKSETKGSLFFGIGINMKNSYITVHVPSGKELETVKIKSDTGKVKVSDLNINDINIASDTGKTALSNVTASTLVLDTSTGKIVISDFEAQESTIKSDTGSISISDAKLGDCVVKNNTGSVKLDKVAVKTMNIKTDTGNVDCNIAGNEEDYDMSLKTDVGSIKVNGDKQGNKYVKTVGLKKTIDISADTGSIKVNFN